jgi:hypothetical protein
LIELSSVTVVFFLLVLSDIVPPKNENTAHCVKVQ